jgi:uncharacterized membrane protein
MKLFSLETAVLWVLALVGFIALFLGVTILSMKLSKKLSKPKR